MAGNMIMKALMGASIGLTFITLLFFAPRGWALTSSASQDKVERKQDDGKHGTRGPRYVFLGGYYGGK